MKPILLFLVLCGMAASVSAQETRGSAPNVFLDCQYWCDMPFLRTEMRYINFVRDRADADVFIQQAGMNTGSGGDQITLLFFGQHIFEGQRDTLRYVVPPASSESDIRDALKRNLDLGLISYLLQTDMAGYIRFSVDMPAPDSLVQSEQEDPWNYWTFSVNGYANFNGQEVARRFRVGGGLNARRVTERHKTFIYASGNYNRDRFEFDDGEPPQTYESGGYHLGASQVMAIDDHWSYGFDGWTRQSLFQNLKQQTSVEAGMEYDIFPYGEAVRRSMIFQYRLGPLNNEYFDETIYFKTRELLFRHSLSADYEQVVQWGRFYTGLRYGNYWHDWALNYFNLYGGVSLNLFKGFRLNINSSYNFLRNQIELPNNGASKDEALLAIRQQQTGFQYSMNCNISYTFGSIYSNVVNPRFDL